MTTYSNRGLHGQLVESLGRRIVQGEIEPGEIIDLNRLGAELEVSRTVVREAVKVLLGKGLLDARPKHGTYVRERAAWNLLDPDVMNWRETDGPDRVLLRELEEVRQMLEPVAARFAAERRTDTHLEAMAEALAQMGEHSTDISVHIDADLAFHRSMAAAGGNELLERLSGILAPAQRSRDLLVYASGRDHDRRFVGAHRAVFEAIVAQDPDEAEAAMKRLLLEAAADTEAVAAQAALQGERD
ncbi:MAG: FadR family transcriptional regulator [Nitriliruptoraceae bacterium]|nr:FadR family transcriptional regulator [Nitriliruptoraceae bacterium]